MSNISKLNIERHKECILKIGVDFRVMGNNFQCCSDGHGRVLMAKARSLGATNECQFLGKSQADICF
jgi:hypothetical protein